MKAAFRFVLPILGAFLHFSLQAQVPQLVSYQGRVVVGGVNFNGTGQFKFALVGPGGTPSFWSNNGTSVNGSEPSAAVSLSVANGLYSVLLGDATLPNMTAIPTTVFNNGDVRLRIWFNDAINGFQLLTPDQRIAAVGYAMMAGNVPDGAITAAKIADGTITASKFAADAIGSAQLGNDLDLGTPSQNGRLDIYRTAANTPGISLVGNTSTISTYGSDGLEQIRLHGTSYGEVLLYDTTNNTRTVRLSAGDESGSLISQLLGGPAPGGSLLLSSQGGTNRVLLGGNTSGGFLTLYQNDGQIGVQLDGDDGGAGILNIRSTNGSSRIQLDGLSSVPGGGGELSVFAGNGTETVEILGAENTQQGGRISLRSDTGVLNVRLRAEEFGGTGEGGILELFNSEGTQTVEVDGDSIGGGYIDTKNQSGSTRAQMQTASDGGGFIALRNNAGTTTIILDGDSSGEGRVTTQVLQITGGSDLSEQFDITPVHDELKPGMIVCIDPDKPGQLVTSTQAYDKTVAGIVSGAGGVKPGMLMGQAGTAADGKHPVALTGRVYCMVDASHGAIRPGDLITTSNTPGHGMKVKDHSQAQGAIIGKAMSSLDAGQGLVLVLVSLQ